MRNKSVPLREDKKSQLKGTCIICLTTGHRAFECALKKKDVFYCGKRNHHHRSLCRQTSGSLNLNIHSANLKENTKPLEADSQDRINRQQISEEKESNLNESDVQIYWPQKNLEVKIVLWQQTLQQTK